MIVVFLIITLSSFCKYVLWTAVFETKFLNPLFVAQAQIRIEMKSAISPSPASPPSANICQTKYLIARASGAPRRIIRWWNGADYMATWKTLQECKTVLTSQYYTIFFIFVFFSPFVFLSRHHSDQMSEGSQLSKVTLCVQILKWQSFTTHSPLRRVDIELPGQLRTK